MIRLPRANCLKNLQLSLLIAKNRKIGLLCWKSLRLDARSVCQSIRYTCCFCQPTYPTYQRKKNAFRQVMTSIVVFASRKKLQVVFAFSFKNSLSEALPMKILNVNIFLLLFLVLLSNKYG